MKVQVVKDAWGVEVWPMNVELVYIMPTWGFLWERHAWRKRRIIDIEPETDIGKKPYWTNRKWNWGRNKPLLTAKECAKLHPDLMGRAGVGTIKILDLTI